MFFTKKDLTSTFYFKNESCVTIIHMYIVDNLFAEIKYILFWKDLNEQIWPGKRCIVLGYAVQSRRRRSHNTPKIFKKIISSL